MNVLSSGSYDVVTETGIPALVPMSLSSSPVSYGNQSYTFVQNYTTDIYYQTDVQSISVTEKTSTQVLPDLTCSLSSSTSIVFSLSSSNNEGILALIPSQSYKHNTLVCKKKCIPILGYSKQALNSKNNLLVKVKFMKK